MRSTCSYIKRVFGGQSWLCMAPEHLVSLGPIGAISFGTLWGSCWQETGITQDLQGGGDLLKEKMNSTIQMDFLCIITTPQEFASLTTMPKIYAEKSTDGLIPWSLYLKASRTLLPGEPLPTLASPGNLPICVGGSSERETLFHPDNEQSDIRWPLLGSCHRKPNRDRSKQKRSNMLQLKQEEFLLSQKLCCVLMLLNFRTQSQEPFHFRWEFLLVDWT